LKLPPEEEEEKKEHMGVHYNIWAHVDSWLRRPDIERDRNGSILQPRLELMDMVDTKGRS
jgi:hypothetical protein